MTLSESEAHEVNIGATPEPERGAVMQRVWDILMDPRSIQWIMMMGGGLMVLGLIIWLAVVKKAIGRRESY